MRRTSNSIQYSFCPNHTSTIEALSLSKLSGREFRIILFIMRQTDGYLRDEDQISPAFFERKTGISRTNVPHVLSRLRRFNILSINSGRPPTYSVNPPHLWNKSIFVKFDESFSSDLTRHFVNNGEKQLRSKDNLHKTYYRGRSRPNNRGIDPHRFSRGKYGHMVARSTDDLKRIKGGKSAV